MAKQSMIEREKKRKQLVERYAEKRKKIRQERKLATSLDELLEIQKKFQQLPRNSASNRLRNRCWKTGRPRGFFRFFGLCRNAIRTMAHDGLLPGVTKSSW